ncbi:SHIRT domain-containing protein [Bifidobacterium tsurumiense]|uniref:SHIRT domain-containing protein n=1 Tax=Bifidobacterium tsurumiense TaxID=356829 RepID=UPI0012B36EF2|nr:SHIRT domain-containing protein [Bifidobacterium tsurumiense]MSS13345.1 LPXTG cell wall anchor domain-containing protein [Bifidobacterium tsurumiense]
MNAESAKASIESNNRTSIAELRAAIQQQEAYNIKFKEDITSAVNTMFGKVWDANSLQLTDEQLANLAVITPAKNAEHPFGLNADGIAFNNKGKVAVGDSWSYSNVLEDPKTGSWVDLKLTLVKAWNTSRIENPNPPEVSEVRLSGSKLGTNEVSMYAGDFDVQVNVEFLEHGTNIPVSLTPMLIYTDVDEKQAVRIDSGGGDYLRLMGSRGQEVTDRSSRQFGASANLQGGSADNSLPVREYWAIFMLQETSSFTYTFFDGPGTDVLHGIGSGALDFNRPTDKEHAQAEITLYRQAVKHSVEYEIIGDSPEESSALPASQEYEHNANVAIAGDLTTDSDVKDGIDGVWSFRGWTTDKVLTEAALGFAITKDTTLYGGWTFEPNQYKVTHGFKSGTAGKALPEDIASRVPDDKTGVVTGDLVEPGSFNDAAYEDNDNDGVWSFRSWDKSEATISRSNAHFIGTWVFVPNAYKVTHVFRSGTVGMELPEVVAERVPEDVTDLVNGSVVEPGTFDDSDYVDTANDGVWSFRTWDSSEVTIDRADAQVVGTWVFTANTKPVPPASANNVELELPSKPQLAKTGAASSWAMVAAAIMAVLGVAILSLRKRFKE